MSDKDSTPSVAILYIATGRYTVFWEYFYQSAEKFLLPDCDKHYILFTDNTELLSQQSHYSNVTMIEQEALEWPYIALMRYQIILSVRYILEQYDFTFYFNGNTEFLSKVSKKDLLPLEANQEITLYLQPHVFHKNRNKYPYDRNSKSNAYIPYNQGKYYFAGGITGGRTESYLEMCEILHSYTESDLQENIIALWHDESYLNKFALDRDDIKVLPPYFTKGENEYWKNTSKLMFSDKTHYRFGGHAYLRSETNEKITPSEWKKNNAKPRRRFTYRFKQYFKSLFFR